MSSKLFCRHHFLKHILTLRKPKLSVKVKHNQILGCIVDNDNYDIKSQRHRSNEREKGLSSLVRPIPVKLANNADDINVGAELTGGIKKDELLKLLNQFARRPIVLKLAAENGLDTTLFHKAFISFRLFCADSEQLPVDLHIVLSDIIQNAGHVDDIFPYFLRHAKQTFPHLDCMEDLQNISDLRLPANWYPEARSTPRKIIIHAGPTNSGKTYHALERFLSSKSGVYCGPLKLLATEVFHKSNKLGTPCDLVTGEERRMVNGDDNPTDHVACTVEMVNVTKPFEVAVIDEIQMIKDPQRGWAWTRALLGLCAQEVHLCGEGSAINMVSDLMTSIGDEVQVRKYKRLTKLTYLDYAVESFENVKAGDCIVCFSKNDIYHISRQLELRGKEVAVIYGGLPPGTKLAQAQKFNDPNDPCKIMVATDAIGMGLNLSIKRIIFYSMMKPTLNEKGEKEMDVISTSQALQIGGRAGRYGTEYENGEVTTFRSEDLHILKDVSSRLIEPIEQAGLHPTADQIELFAYHLPKATLSNLIDIFVTLCRLDNDNYFMCDMEDFKFLADMIQHVPLNLRVRYTFCCAPIPKKQPYVCTMFLKFARQFSRNEPLTLDWLCLQIGWPFAPPGVLADLVHLEGVFDILDLYLWLSYRFPEMFPDVTHIRDMQTELDQVIQQGVRQLTTLLKSRESTVSTGTQDTEDDFEIKVKKSKRKNKLRLDSLVNELTKIDSSDNNVDKQKYGGLTGKLIGDGLITSAMADKMHEEWSKKINKNKSDD